MVLYGILFTQVLLPRGDAMNRLASQAQNLQEKIRVHFGITVPVRTHGRNQVIRLRLARAQTANGWTAEFVQCASYQYDQAIDRPVTDNARYVVVTGGLYAIVFLNRAEGMPDNSLRSHQLPSELVEVHVKNGFDVDQIMYDIEAILG
jgi:hypothetical protein